MASGINISFVSDVRQFLSGTKDAESAMAKVGDSLDGLTDAGKHVDAALGKSLDAVSRDAKDTASDVGRSFDKVESEAKSSAQDLERKFSDAFKEVSKDAKAAGSDVGTHVKRGTEEASEGVEGLRENAQANLKETAASFDGTLDSFAGGVQGLAAEALEGFGPIGLAGGAILTGVAGAFYSSWRENSENTKQVVSDMYDDLIQSGEDYLSESYRQQTYWDILQDKSKVVGLDRVKQIAEYSKTSSEEVALAYSGDADAMTVVTNGLVKARAVFNAQLHDEKDTNDDAARSGLNYINSMITANEARTASIKSTTDTIAHQRDVWNDANSALAQGAQSTTDRLDAVGRAVASIPSQKNVDVMVTTPDHVTIPVHVDTTAADRAMAAFTRGFASKYAVGVSVRPTIGKPQAG